MIFLSRSPSHPVLLCPLPVPYPFLKCPLPVHYPSSLLGLSRSHKGMGTDTIFDFRPPPPPTTTTTKLFRSLYSPLGIPSPSLYLSLQPPLPLGTLLTSFWSAMKGLRDKSYFYILYSDYWNKIDWRTLLYELYKVWNHLWQDCNS